MLKQLSRLSLACVVAVSLCGWAVAHEHDEHGAHSAMEYGYHNGYLDGFQHGREDRAAQVGYNFRSRDYDRATRGYESYMGSAEQYRNGYREGYVAGYDDGYYERGARFEAPPGAFPPYRDPYRLRGDASTASVAFRIGYKDGLIAGRKDRRHNKNFRPEKHDRYKDAHHGYRDDYGRKKEYKREYREGFIAGYQCGYGDWQAPCGR